MSIPSPLGSRASGPLPCCLALIFALVGTLSTAQAQSTATPPRVGLQLMRTWSSKSALSAGGGTNTMQDLKRLLGPHGEPSTDTSTSGDTLIYKDITYLMPLVDVRKKLGLTKQIGGKIRVTCAGIPDGLSYNSFSGVFEEGFTRMDVVTDLTEQVVSIQLVDEAATVPAHFWPEAGWHTYNFINGRTKGRPTLRVYHRVTPHQHGVQVDSHVWDGKAGKNLEVSRWYVPKPLINLILHVAS